MKNKAFALLLSIVYTAASLTVSAAGESPDEAAVAAEQNTEQDVPERLEEEFPPIPDDLTGGKPWIDSVVVGNVTADTQTSPTDDFYLYANKDWILSHEIPEGLMSVNFDNYGENKTDAMKALAGEELSGHDAHQAQLFFTAFIDTEARDAAGCEPAKAVIDEIRSISNIEEMTDFLLDIDRNAGVPGLFRVYNTQNKEENCWETRIGLADGMFGSTINTMGMNAETIDPESEVYQARFDLIKGILTRTGYTDEEAEKVFEGRLELEKEIIRITDENRSEEDEPLCLTMDQLESQIPNFPLDKLAETRGYGQAENFYIADAVEFSAASEIYDDAHLDKLRDYLICGYVSEVGSWLDTEAFDAWCADYYANTEGVIKGDSIEDTAFNLEVKAVPTLIGRAFVEACDLEEVKEFIISLYHDAVDAHKEIVNSCEWLSEAGKKKLTEKLDAIDIYAVYPDAWEDYSGLNLEGLNYYEVRRAVWVNDIERNASLTGAQIDDRLWGDAASLFSIGGLYYFDSNAFRVEAGVVAADVRSYLSGDLSFEELMGGNVGYVIFHETGHVLDNEDIYYDLNGNEMDEPLIGGADLEEYERRVSKVQAYLDSITIWEGQHVPGSVCLKEAIGEINGMQARLAYVAKQKDFDYKVFFENRTRCAPRLYAPEYELGCVLGGDYHPSAYLDTNVTFQQFDEFMEAFDVKEGDAMYLAPEDRLAIW